MIIFVFGNDFYLFLGMVLFVFGNDFYLFLEMVLFVLQVYLFLGML